MSLSGFLIVLVGLVILGSISGSDLGSGNTASVRSGFNESPVPGVDSTIYSSKTI